MVGSPRKGKKEGDGFVISAIVVFEEEAGASHVWVLDKETMKVHKRKVKGKLANPTVSPLSPLALVSELKAIMRRIFRLPIKVIQPLRRGKEGK